MNTLFFVQFQGHAAPMLFVTIPAENLKWCWLYPDGWLTISPACVCVFSSMHKHTGIKPLFWSVFACFWACTSTQASSFSCGVCFACFQACTSTHASNFSCGVCSRIFEHGSVFACLWACTSTYPTSYCSGVCSGLACFESRSGHVFVCALHSVVFQLHRSKNSSKGTATAMEAEQCERIINIFVSSSLTSWSLAKYLVSFSH
jgi:hypothetical protein